MQIVVGDPIDCSEYKHEKNAAQKIYEKYYDELNKLALENNALLIIQDE
jgi:hypothetical protein